MKSQVFHTVWCNISGEAAGEIWNWSLVGVKGLTESDSQYWIGALCNTKWFCVSKEMRLTSLFTTNKKRRRTEATSQLRTRAAGEPSQLGHTCTTTLLQLRYNPITTPLKPHHNQTNPTTSTSQLCHKLQIHHKSHTTPIKLQHTSPSTLWLDHISIITLL